MTPDRSVRTYAIPCAVPGCDRWTADEAPATDWITAAAAVHAAGILGWIHVPGPDRRHVWVCTRHQVWDPRRNRWVYDTGARG